MNIQPAEKGTVPYDEFLDLHSIFFTIQGEGPFSGTPAIFIRLAGCNLCCPGCDTEYTLKRKASTVDEILHRVRELGRHGLVVITGGEPFRQDIGALVNTLVDEEYYVQVETNGTLPPSAAVHWSLVPYVRAGAYIVCSPKTGKINEALARESCCFKYVLEHGSVGEDGLPVRVLQHSASPRVARPPYAYGHRPVYVQPMDSADAALNALNMRAAVDSCMAYGHILQLQIHKIIGVP